MCLRHQLPDGTTAIICGMKSEPKFCRCGRPADFLCDWKVPDRKSGTCDAPVCKEHAKQVAPNKHLCEWHQKAYEIWRKKKGIPEQAELFAG